MYKLREVVVTNQGIGHILSINHDEYHVCVEFPYDTKHSYETWMNIKEIRYSLTNLNKTPSIDDYIPPRPVKPKIKKQKSKYSYGSYKNVWR